ncbi:MAG TPA: zinc-ribbon domain-containing protein [Ktedonobacteraceae bacterium]|nr:zinc-ribbon domain-containing protein [Ktedonobacteraceae bacterium]
MFCIHCGEKNPDTAMFCRMCGMPLEKQVDSPVLSSPFQVNAPVLLEANSPTGHEQIPFSDVPTIQAQSGIVDAPTLTARAGFPYATPPSGNAQNGESAGPGQLFEQFSFSEPTVLAAQPDIQGASPLQIQPTPSSSGYLSDGFQSPGSPAAYPSLYRQEPANQGSGALPDMQIPAPFVPPSAMPPTSPTAGEPRVRAIARPLPVWAFILSIVAGVAVLAALFFTGSDWAAGATRAGIVGGILAILILLAAIVRTLAGMAARSNPKRRSQFISAGLLVAILLAVSGFGLTQQATIHQVQGRFYEGQQQWQSAINEFQLAGEHAPTSGNIARIYDEWGEQLSNTQHYSAAIDKFNIVLTSFQAATGEVTRAQADSITAYLNWGKQASQQHDYNDAVTHFGDLLNLSYCNANCQAEASALSATAYYDLAETQLTAQQYADAANSFQTLATLFPKSPEAQKDHEDFAKALFGEGKQQLVSSCSSAIPTYQELASKFGDTPEGQQASIALKAPQEVIGRFTTPVPKGSALTPLAVLAQGLYANIPDAQFFQLIAGAPTVVIKPDGTFTFKPVKQGTYDLAWGTDNVDGSQSFYFYYRPSDKSLVYVANVGPLCPYNFGSINEPIPVAP